MTHEKHNPQEPAKPSGGQQTSSPNKAGRREEVARIIEICAVAAEQQDRSGREWVHDSLWANILKRAGANVRALDPDAILALPPTQDEVGS